MELIKINQDPTCAMKLLLKHTIVLYVMSEMDACEYLSHPSRIERHEPAPVIMKHNNGISGDD